MSDMLWETFDGLFKVLHSQGRRVADLEARVVELERRLQQRAAEPSPYLRAALVPTPLGFTLYDREGNPTPVLFPGAERRIAVVGVDPGAPEVDRGVRVVMYREDERERPGAPTRLRVLSVEPVEKESPDRGKAESEAP